MSENTNPQPTAKFRVIDKDFGDNLLDVFLYAHTTDEEIYSLLDRAKRAGQIAAELDFTPSNLVVASANVERGKKNPHNFELRYETNNLLHCVSMDIIPKPGGMTQVQYFGDTYRKPRDDYFTVSSFLSPPDLVKMFDKYYTFQEETFRMARSFKVDFWVEWYESSKKNTQGNPYKNVSQLHVAENAEPPEPMEAPPPPQKKEVSPADDVPF